MHSSFGSLDSDHKAEGSNKTNVVGLIDRYSNLPWTAPSPLKIAQLLSRSLENTTPNPFRSKAFNPDRRIGKKGIAELIARYEAGEPISTLAHEYGVSKSGMNDLLKKHGVVLQYRPMTEEDIRRAAIRYNEGAALSELATEFTSSQETIRKSLIRNGVKMRPARRA